MLKKVLNFIKNRPGLTILIFILFLITVLNIKPDFYLIGWDNYSSYFNLKTNIFKTFFATWREYRGLGVPSDAEVTDVFRQIFYWIVHFFIPEQLLDQLYYIFALWFGVLSMYFCSYLLFNHYLKEHPNVELFSTVSAFFYLFNLNTLSIFYSPIIPFTNRFYSLPLIIYFFVRFISSRKYKDFILLSLVIIFTSGSYITPTVIITNLLALLIFFLFWVGFKKTIMYLLLFLFLNSFWLLSFFNYVIQKSSIVPLARTFIEINESTLNRNPSKFSLEKQAILYPSFFDMNFSSQNGRDFTIHPQLNEYNQSQFRFVLWLFPILYVIGSVLIVKNWKKNKRFIWIPFWIFVFLFLSTKEFGLFGFIYKWLTKIIPFFNIIFRISDTKFHAYISFAGSLAASCTVVSLYQYKKVISKGIIVFSFIYIWLFRSYFNGNLIGFFSYTKIPQAYFDIANVINQDSEKSRVLHLPIDQWQHYWRSFSWGYLGSAFFNFLIDKPYIDKTFEPASMENAYLHAKINNLLDQFYRTTDFNQKDKFAKDFLKIVQNVGIKYILVDESISSAIYTRNLIYTARQSYIKAKEMLDYLVGLNQVVLLNNYRINLKELYSVYKKLYPVSKTGYVENLPEETNIYLYKLISSRPIFSLTSMTKNIDPNLNNLLETEALSFIDSTIIQNEEMPYQLIPFMQQNHKISKNDGKYILEYKNSNLQSRYFLNTLINSNNSNMIDVFANVNEEKLNLNFYHRYYPDINNHQFRRFIGKVSFDWNPNLNDYRLKLNDVFTEFPNLVAQNDTYITSYITHEKTIKTTILSKISEKKIDIETFTKTTPSSCYGPQLEGYEESVLRTKEGLLQLESKFGSVCVESQINLPNDNKDYYLEINIRAKGKSSKNSPIDGYVCISESGIPDCFNLHRHLRIFNNLTTYKIPLNSYVMGLASPKIRIGLIPQINQKQSLEIESVVENIYLPISEKEISFKAVFPQEIINLEGSLQISFPQAQSLYSYFHDPNSEFFDFSQNICRGGRSRKMYYKKNVLYNEMDDCDVYFAQKFNYVFGYPYLFAYEYEVDSGQQPNILLGREGDNYLLEKASLYQGYPNLKGELIYASRLFEPSVISDTFSKYMSIHLTQDTANKGILGVRAFDMVEYPTTWHYLTLIPEGSEKFYNNSGKIRYKQILSSLWKVEIDNNSKNLLVFNEGYDKQWGIYKNLFNLLFGRSLTKSIRCDGYANCFEISYRSFYVFYWPERLYFIGWVLTIFTIIFSFRFFNKDF